MRNIARTLVLLLMVAALIGCFTFGVCAADIADADTALEYLDGYADNVGTDPSFAENIAAAISVMRESTPTLSHRSAQCSCNAE